MPRGLRHVALSISFLSPMARRPDALFATNIASFIFLPDLRFLALTSFQSLNRPSLSSGSSSRISLLKQSISVSRPRLRPPGNIHRWSRLLLTNNTRPRFVATSFDDFAITLSHCLNAESSVQILFHPVHKERQRLVQRTCRKSPFRVTLGKARPEHKEAASPRAADLRASPLEDCVGTIGSGCCNGELLTYGAFQNGWISQHASSSVLGDHRCTAGVDRHGRGSSTFHACGTPHDFRLLESARSIACSPWQ